VLQGDVPGDDGLKELAKVDDMQLLHDLLGDFGDAVLLKVGDGVGRNLVQRRGVTEQPVEVDDDLRDGVRHVASRLGEERRCSDEAGGHAHDGGVRLLRRPTQLALPVAHLAEDLAGKEPACEDVLLVLRQHLDARGGHAMRIVQQGLALPLDPGVLHLALSVAVAVGSNDDGVDVLAEERGGLGNVEVHLLGSDVDVPKELGVGIVRQLEPGGVLLVLERPHDLGAPRGEKLKVLAQLLDALHSLASHAVAEGSCTHQRNGENTKVLSVRLRRIGEHIPFGLGLQTICQKRDHSYKEK